MRVLFVLLMWAAIPNWTPKTPEPIDWTLKAAIAFVESSFDPCAENGQYRGMFQQGTLCSNDLGRDDSRYVWCSPAAASRAFDEYQRKYWYLTKGRAFDMIVLWSAGPGNLKKGFIPVNYVVRVADAYRRIQSGRLIVRNL